MKRGDIHERIDVNYSANSAGINTQYAKSQYPLATINDIAKRLQYGSSSLSTAEPIGLPILRMVNLQQDGWDLSDLKYIDLPENEAETYRLVPGDLLFNRTNSKELVGKCAVFQERGHWVFASYLIRVSIDLQKALPDYVSDFLSTSAGRAQIDRVSRQIVGMSNINAEEIKALQIPLPPLEKQAALVAQMQTARAARADNLARADALLSGMDAYLMDALGLVPPPADPRTTYAVRLADVRNPLHSGRCDADYFAPRYATLERALADCPHPKQELGTLSPDLAGGATPTRADEDLYAADGVKFLRILNIKPNEIDLADVKHVTQDVHDELLGRSQLATDDVLMTITGRVGTAAVVPADILPANINQHLVRLRLQTDDCQPEYLAAYLNSSVGLALTNRGVTGGTRIALDYVAIRKIQIPVPSPEIQAAIVAEIGRRRGEARQLRARAQEEWAAAKAGFERALLGDTGKTNT